LARAGDIDGFDRCIDLEGSLAARLNQPTLNWMHAITRSGRAQIAGNTDRLEQLASETLQIGNDSGQPDAAALFAAQRMAVNLMRGTLGELVPGIEQAAAEHPGLASSLAAWLALPTPRQTRPTERVGSWTSSQTEASTCHLTTIGSWR
jgi:hypothetical protein